MSRNRYWLQQPRRCQSGFLLPLAAFIIVAMGLMALTIARTTTQTALGSVQEQVSLQAFYAGESGAQYAMNQLFYRTDVPVTRSLATSACATVNGTTLTFSAVGLRQCSATLSCSASVNSVGADIRTYFSITSRGSCAFSNITAERITEVAAALGDE